MKQTNQLPRTVGYSLLKSLNAIAKNLISASEMTPHNYHEEIKIQMIARNANLFTSTDIDALKNIRKFYEDSFSNIGRDDKLPTGSFITIAKHPKPNLKYVSTPTAVGIVLTTAMLKRVLTLALSVGCEIKGRLKADYRVKYVCEAENYGVMDNSVGFIKILDMLRYFNEVNTKLIEISLDGVQNDYVIENSRGNSYYSRRYNSSGDKMKVMYPMVSDRYQEDSWKHYLNTLYNGLTTPDAIHSLATKIPMSIMMAELKGLEV
tara:strand:+ start:488 stop:1276 length:789 start_codon:yes stop_codon:yes gene_type:complete